MCQRIATCNGCLDISWFPWSKVTGNLKVVQEERIDGAEVVYDLYRIDMGEEKELRAEQGQVEDLIERYRLLKSGGSDAHTRERLIQMTKTPWFAQKTVGMTEKILAVKPDLFNKWSSL